jgi:hypothetical protein
MWSFDGQILRVILPFLAVEFSLVPIGCTRLKSESVEYALLASVHY